MSQGVTLDHVTMRFGGVDAVRDLSLDIQPGEFFSILGPSGCGKTTALRMIAGFLQPTSGRILIGGRDMAGLGPNARPTAMIFQSLALFPLMPVWENIAFGLEMRGVPRAERRKRADALLDLIALPGFGDRRIGELSGGQRQRVAIARALAVEPQVLLLDEPLSALDLKLRQHMRAELRSIQKRTGVTFLYITHDQSEALAMSDRVAVMEKGVLQQVASPRDLYLKPATPFVATFVGETNALPGRIVARENGLVSVETQEGRFLASGEAKDGPATLYVRPEILRLAGYVAGDALAGTVTGYEFEGPVTIAQAMTARGATLRFVIPTGEADRAPQPGDSVRLSFPPHLAVALPDA